jgi:hypothetical protein
MNAATGELVKQFTEAINLDADCKLDICLFWDFFNYLDRPALKALMAALEPNIDQYSRGHSLGLLNARNQLPFNRYGIHSSGSLSQAERQGEQPIGLSPFPARAQYFARLLGD